MLNLCDSGHDEICFVGHTCPLCEKIEDTDKEIANLGKVISSMEDDMSTLEEKVRDLENGLASLRERGDLA